jgi:tetratricopeptide (TPR) repeat protein
LKSAEICLKNDDLPQVKKLLKKLKIPEENPELYFIKGIYYYKRENLAKSKKYFKKSVKLVFEEGKSYFFLGDIYLLQKNCEKSFECYQKSLMHVKGSVVGLVKVSQAIIYFYSEKFEIMLKTLKESLNYGPNIKEFIRLKGFGNSINNENFFYSVEFYLKCEYLQVIKLLKPMFRQDRLDLIPGMILALAYFKMFKFEKSLHYLKKLQKNAKINEGEIALLVIYKAEDLAEKCQFELEEAILDESSVAPNKPYSFLITA